MRARKSRRLLSGRPRPYCNLTKALVEATLPAQRPAAGSAASPLNSARSRRRRYAGDAIRFLVADFRTLGRPVARPRHRKSHVDRKPGVPAAFAAAIRIRLDVSDTSAASTVATLVKPLIVRTRTKIGWTMTRSSSTASAWSNSALIPALSKYFTALESMVMGVAGCPR